VLQRFERRLEGLVEGAFARAFGGVVQPVEVAAALQREAADKKAIVGQGRVLVPNDYTVELSSDDSERLAEYDEPLRKELGDMVTEHAQEQGWSFVGPVQVHFESVPELATGVFRVRSTVLAAPAGPATTSPAAGDHGHRRLELVAGSETGRVVRLTPPSVVIGRGAEADVRLTDTGVSRRHAELHVDDDAVTLVDLRSTNGTSVNGERVDRRALVDGDRIAVGATVIVFRQDA
jgi:nucleotide-binding universal stress UspA family protein